MSESTRFWVAVSAVSLGQALRIDYGQMHPVALALLALACLSLLLSYRKPRPIPARWTRVLLTVTLAAGIVALPLRPPAAGLVIAPEEYSTYASGCWLLLGVAGVLWRVRFRWLFPVLLIAHAVIAGWVLRHSVATVDVAHFQRHSSEALVAGENPYAITFPDPQEGRHPEFYGPGLVRDGRLMFGYPYMPLPLIAILPGYLAGEFRVVHVAAVLLAALLMYASASDDTGRLAAAVFLFTPWVFHLEAQGWVDAFFVLLFAAMMYAATRYPRIVPWVLAALIGTKQYGILVLAATARMVRWRGTVLAVSVAAATVVPFLLWDARAFLHSAVWLQFQQPWRTDALSFSVALDNAGVARLPWLSFVVGGVAGLFVWRREETHPSLVARNAAFVYLAFFAFAKQAFYNYYFLVVGVLCCAIAAAAMRAGTPEEQFLSGDHSASTTPLL